MTIPQIISAASMLWPNAVAEMLAGRQTAAAVEIRHLIADAAREMVPCESWPSIAAQVGLRSHSTLIGRPWEPSSKYADLVEKIVLMEAAPCVHTTT